MSTVDPPTSTKVRLTLQDAEHLSSTSLQKLGYTASDAATITHHLLDTEIRGNTFAGLARVLSIADRVHRPERGLRGAAGEMMMMNPTSTSTSNPSGGDAIAVTRQNPATAQIDGNDAVGYLVGRRATELAIEKAKAVGVGVVGAHNTWYTGMLSYYAEMCARRDLVCVIASHCTAWVAPAGGTEPRFGTNPFCIGFPSSSSSRKECEPVVWDIGTSNIIHAQCKLAIRTGEEIPEGSAFDKEGRPTRDPLKALEGALTVWGGHKGSGLAVAVQLLGALAGASSVPPEMERFGMLVITIDPGSFGNVEAFKDEVGRYGDFVRSTRPVEGGNRVRMPFERSAEERRRVIERGWVEIEREVVKQMKEL